MEARRCPVSSQAVKSERSALPQPDSSFAHAHIAGAEVTKPTKVRAESASRPAQAAFCNTPFRTPSVTTCPPPQGPWRVKSGRGVVHPRGRIQHAAGSRPRGRTLAALTVQWRDPDLGPEWAG